MIHAGKASTKARPATSAPTGPPRCKRAVWICLVVAAAATLAAGSARPAAEAQATCPGADSGPAAGVSALTAATACLIAAERSAAGAPPVRVHPSLATSARLHAEDMVARGYASDVSPNGDEASDRALRAGYGRPPATPYIQEAFTFGFGAASTPRAAIQRWRADPAARRVLLAPWATNLGVGVAAGAPTPGQGPAATYVADVGARTEPPEPGKTVVVARVSGVVLIEVRGRGGAAHAAARRPPRFVPLRGTRVIPVGVRVDTRRGRVRLTSASDLRGRVQTSDFFDGMFRIRQRRTARPVTDVVLAEQLQSCPPRSATAQAARKGRRKKAARRRFLWGDGKGRFRTRGRYGTAAVIGTRWLVEDSCAGTRVRVRRGAVLVRDLRTGRTRRLRAGQSVLLRR